MPGNEEINRIGIELYIDDKTPEGLADAQSHALASSEKFGAALNNNLSDSSRKAAESFGAVTKANDRFSDSLSKATSIKEHAIRSVGRMAEMFNPFNLAIGAAVVGIRALGAALMKAVRDDLTQYDEALKKTTEETKKLADATKEAMDRQVALNSGVTETHLQAHELIVKRNEATLALGKAEEDLVKFRKFAMYYEAGTFVSLQDEIKARESNILKMRMEIDKLNELIGRKRAAAESEVAVAGAPELVPINNKPVNNKPGAPAPVQVGKPGMFSTLMAGLPSIDEAMNYASSYVDVVQGELYGALMAADTAWTEKANENTARRVDANRTAYETMLALERGLLAERQANMMRHVEMTEDIAGTISSITQTVGKVAQAAIKDEQKRMKATAAITAILESIQAAVEIAKAIGAYPDVVGMAAHAASAAAHITAAVLAAKYGGGGATTPSKSAAGTGAAASGAVSPAGEEQKATTTIIVQGHIFTPETGSGFVRSALAAGENQRNPGRDRTEMG